ncbi:carbon-nitrogen family hydrolase [Mycolicibacterium sp. XJ870]
MSTDSTMRIAVLQTAFDETEQPETRLARVMQLIHAHRAADLVVLPELWAHGAFTPATWRSQAESLDGPLVRALSTAARDCGVYLHGGSIVESALPTADRGPQGRGLWNTSVLFGPDGALLATYRKVHRFGFGEGEPQLLEAGTALTTVDLPHGRIGLATCYDLRFPELFRALVDRGVSLFVVTAAWPAPRRDHWELLGRARALENQAFVVQCNTAGAHGGLQMAGHSQVVDPYGRIIAQAADTADTFTVDIDLAVAQQFRDEFPVLADRRFGDTRAHALPR